MDPLLILGVAFLTGLFAGMPVAVVLGVSSVAYLLAADLPLEVVPLSGARFTRRKARA